MKQEVPIGEQLAMPLTKGAKLVGIGLSHAYKAMRNGELKTFKVGRRRMVTRQAIQDFIDRKQREADRGSASG